MSWTNDLRKLVKVRLKRVCDNVYYKIADENALFPHVVFNFSSTKSTDALRTVICDIDIFCKNNQSGAENMADSIEKEFNYENAPQTTILPTFYIMSRQEIIDLDPDINRIEIRIEIQNYERGVE